MECSVNWIRFWPSCVGSLALAGLLWVGPVWADPKNLVNGEAPVSARCVSADGLTYESCGGGGGGGGDGAINDGVSSGIKATVFDRTNSNPVATQLVDSNGDPVSVGGGTQYQQGTAATDTDTLTMLGCVRSDSAAVATGVIDGDRARCIIDSTGRLWVFAAQSGTWSVSQSGTWNIGTITSITNSVAVTGTFWQATQPISAVALPLPAGAATEASVDGLEGGVGAAADAAATAGSTGSLSAKLRLITSQLDAITTELGQKTEPGNIQAANISQIAGTAPASHDALMSGDSVPLTAAGFAETPEDSDGNTNANRVSADGDKTRLLTDRNGSAFVRFGPPHQWSYHENSSSALTDTTVHAACGAGLFNYIQFIKVSNGSTTALNYFIEDGTTTTIWGPDYLEAVNGRGVALTLLIPKKQTTSNTAVSITTSAAVAHSIDIIGFCAP